jgi:hypothetical protein
LRFQIIVLVANVCPGYDAPLTDQPAKISSDRHNMYRTGMTTGSVRREFQKESQRGTGAYR